MTKTEEQEYARGRRAFAAGKVMDDNPHHVASAGPARKYRAWARGWHEAAGEARKARRTVAPRED